MDSETHQYIERYLKLLIVAGAVALVLLCVVLVRQYNQVRRLNYIAAHQSLFAALRAHEPINASDAGTIAGWMTFDYINHLFSLPSQYLQTKLSITDNRYPRLTLEEYAEDHAISENVFVTETQQAVHAFAPGL